MQFSFDLISDLHVETWGDFDWTGQATSPYCVVLGDVSRSQDRVIQTLEHLSQCYVGVFYVDGNDEHRDHMEDLGQSYKNLVERIQNIPNTVYLQDNVIIINGVALLGTNGWWCYDFEPGSDAEQSMIWYRDYISISDSAARSVNAIAYNDANYLSSSVGKLQTHQEVKAIVILTHTVPRPDLTDHDIELVGTHRYNCLGNQHLQISLDMDLEHKIKIWCFGHYHKSVDQHLEGVRYISNPRGRGNTPWSQTAYYAKRITVDY